MHHLEVTKTRNRRTDRQTDRQTESNKLSTFSKLGTWGHKN